MKVGDKFGEWEIIGEASKPYYSLCKCSCGKIKEVNNSTLRLGKSKSCGHDHGNMARELNRKRTNEKMLGKRFGRLVVVERTDTPGHARFICQCDCGNRITVLGSSLLTGTTTSCGCIRRENSKRLMEIIKQSGYDARDANRFEGTNIASLNENLSKSNKTGFKGVSKMKNGRYRAYINIRGVHKHLGVFDTAEDAAEARKIAEKEIYQPIIDRYNEANKEE